MPMLVFGLGLFAVTDALETESLLVGAPLAGLALLVLATAILCLQLAGIRW